MQKQVVLDSIASRFAKARIGSGFVYFLHVSQLGMALSAGAFLYLNAQMLGYALSGSIYLSAVLATLGVYLWDARNSSSSEDEINQPKRARWVSRYRKKIPTIVIAAFGVAGICVVPHLSWGTFLGLSAFSLVCFAYLHPAVPTVKGFRRVKEIPFLKAFVINACWLGGGTLLPIAFASAKYKASGPLWLLLGVNGSLLFLDTLSLNYRDREGDRRAGLKTVATVLDHRTVFFLRAATTVVGAIAFICCWLYSVALSFSATIMAMTVSFWVFTTVIEKLKADEIWFNFGVSGWRFIGAITALFFASRGL